MRAGATAIILVMVAACSAGPGSSPSPEIRLDHATAGAGVRAVRVVGLPAHVLAAVRARSLSADEWQSVLRVTVDVPHTNDLPAVAGVHAIEGDALMFVPEFPLDPQVAHRVIFDLARLPDGVEARAIASPIGPLELTIAATPREIAATTRVTQVFPGEVLLENQLRLYVQFSAPMDARGANQFVRLLDQEGKLVDGAFLPIDISLWNADRTRYTLLFDPGRVKRGILPNQEMGRPLAAGRSYTLVVDREWRDAEGQPLVTEFRRELRVEPAVLEPIAPAAWRLSVPTAGTREPLTVSFPRPLDHALAQRTLFVVAADGRAIDGEVSLDDAATRWSLVPRGPWPAGAYRLAALPELEDPAGNRIGRAFDFDPGLPPAARGVSGDAHAAALVPFVIGAAPRPSR